MTNKIMAVYTAAFAVLGVSTVAAQGSVVGAALPGTMEQTFTVPFTEFDAIVDRSGCGTLFSGCTGMSLTGAAAVNVEVTNPLLELELPAR